MKSIYLLMVLAVLSSAACNPDRPLSMSIGQAVKRGPGTRLTFTEHVTYPWDRMCIFGPYTTDEQIDQVTGIVDASSRAYTIGSSDAIDLLLFINEKQVVDSLAHPRRLGDFGPEVVGKCYSREEAVFSVRTPPANSWGTIGSAEPHAQ